MSHLGIGGCVFLEGIYTRRLTLSHLGIGGCVVQLAVDVMSGKQFDKSAVSHAYVRFLALVRRRQAHTCKTDARIWYIWQARM